MTIHCLVTSKTSYRYFSDSIRGCLHSDVSILVIGILFRKKYQKSRLFMKVQAFCEENCLRSLHLWIFGMLNLKNNDGKLKNGVLTI